MRLSLIIVLLLAWLQISAQMNFGEFNTPYAGVHALRFNPAEIVDSRYKFHASLLSLNLRASNNFIGVSSELMSISPPVVTDRNKDTYFLQNLDGKDKHAFSQINIMGPTLMMAFGEKNRFSLALSSGFNTLVTANNINQRLAQYFYNNKKPENWVESTSKDFMMNASVWSYIGVTAGTVLFDKPKTSLKFAATGKVNIGLVSTYAYSKSLTLRFASANQLGYANGVLDNQVSAPVFVDEKFKPDSMNMFENMGFGGDLGFIFEKKDGKEYTYEMDCKTDNVRKDLNKYRYRIGLSIVDFGYINWKGKSPLRRVSIDGNAFTDIVGNSKFNKFPDVGKHRDSLLSLLYNGVYLDTTREDYQMWTPTNVNLFFDLRVYKGIYIAANATYGFVMHNKASSWTQNTQACLTPRIESKYFGFYLPVNYNMLASEVNVGLGARLFFMNFALYDWTGIAGLKSQTKNVGFTFSLNVPIHQKAQPKDNDHDLISNKKDKCKDQAGDCNSDGCKEPDDDEDGIANSQDKCPTVKGVKTFDGCPDTDEDGVPDSKDRCPKKKGLRELGGCPDKDGDGLTDAEDKCPSDKGPKEFDGCPDSDGDRIPDNVDECPTVKGVYENRGCPEIIILDTDNDGILDTADKCINEPGPRSNFGCPIPKETISIAKMAQEKLEFETGKSIIKKESYQSLLTLAEYLVKNPNYKLDIAGHTDNVGDEVKNMKLSIDRAQAVKEFFVIRGVSADRIKAEGFGMTRPIADNKTASGRAVNRRVEIDVK